MLEEKLQQEIPILNFVTFLGQKRGAINDR
jgi:hypothetical protein